MCSSDLKFRAEEAFSLENVDNIPVSEGDVLTAQQVARFKADYGDEIFKVEPAFELTEEIEGLPLKVEDIVPLSQAEEHRESAGAPEAFRRAHISNSEAFVVTAALKLPFTKGSIVSKIELELFQQKYPSRFTSVRRGTAQISGVRPSDPGAATGSPCRTQPESG